MPRTRATKHGWRQIHPDGAHRLSCPRGCRRGDCPDDRACTRSQLQDARIALPHQASIERNFLTAVSIEGVVEGGELAVRVVASVWWRQGGQWSRPATRSLVTQRLVLERMAPDVAILTLDDRQRWEEIEAAGAMPSQCWRFAAALACSGYEPRLAVVDADGSRLVLPF